MIPVWLFLEWLRAEGLSRQQIIWWWANHDAPVSGEA